MIYLILGILWIMTAIIVVAILRISKSDDDIYP